MARALLVASLVGARCAVPLASSSDLELMQVWSAPAPSKDDFGREFFTHAGVHIYPRAPNGRRTGNGEREGTEENKTWMFMMRQGATDAELQSVIQELHPTAMKTNPDIGEVPFVEGHLTEDELKTVVEKVQELYPGLVQAIEEDSLRDKDPRCYR
ncbi:unnamed protein product [Prorocentrum cordatum]|uniref:Uncharacterized protein n=1 Tax=Prorocentrum cordatum TaxID=2364126 RepID=A0ABN9SYT1_9DINO|nr:unnamed protein product [Polarella glacialis]